MLQIIDTLFNFAPLNELADVLNDSALDSTWQLEIRQVLAERYLAREDFARARNYMTPGDWALRVGNLESLTAEASKDANRALDLGRAWVHARRKILGFPLDSTETRRKLFDSDHAMANLKRRINARALLNLKNPDPELENREELHHAFRWFMLAADKASQPDIRESALLEALKVIPQIADVSPYSLARAVETDAAALSRKIEDRLHKEFPASKKTREQAAYYSFPPKPENAENSWSWRSGESRYSDQFRESLEETELPGFKKNIPPKAASDFKLLVKQAISLEKKSLETDPADLAAEVKRLQSLIREAYTENGQSVIVNYMDDLALFFNTRGLTRPMANRYVKLRLFALRQSIYDIDLGLPGSEENGDARLLAEIESAQKESVMAPVTDFLDFLKIAVTVNHLIDVPVEGTDKDGAPYAYRSRDWPKVERITIEFLKKNPKSAKREAATMLRARAIYMESKPIHYPRWTDWPQSDRWEGSPAPLFHQREPFDSKRVLAALNDYFKPYGGGQYFADLRLCRADVAIRLKDWPRAVDLLTTQIREGRHPELNRNALQLFADLFACLADDQDRTPLLLEIKKQDLTQFLLVAYLKIESSDHPLRYLKQYLRDQLNHRD